MDYAEQAPDVKTPPEDPDAEAQRLEQERAEAEEDSEIVQRAMECYRLGIDASAEWRRQSMQDLEFMAGDQWDTSAKALRESQGRPIVTVNRLPQFVRQVTNEQRQAKPSITVNPVDSQGDKRTAEVLQGIIRNIEYTSNADQAYVTAGQCAAITGVGYFDICAEYENERSFEQRLTIKRIRNPHSVVMDPSVKELAGDDARWVIISTDITKSEWQSLCPDKDMPKDGHWDGIGDASADWVGKEGVRLHEYRYITEEPDVLFDLTEAAPELKLALQAQGLDVSSGGVLASEVGESFAQRLYEARLPTRATTCRKACYARIAGDEVIERGELAGRYLQLVRVVGTELEINGSVIHEGVVRHAKDTQRILNYTASAEVEAIALAPKAPWLVAEGQIEGYEVAWQNANQKPQAVLTYRPKTLAGQPVPPPQRVMAEANVQAITSARQLAGQDLSEVTGIYPTQFGAPSPEQSGRAILARQTQGQVSNFHFMDNLAQAIRYAGRILIDLIPHIYSGPRIMRILGEDGEHEMVPVNGMQGSFRGEETSIQLDAGRYDVAVSMGPSYLSRRQEAAAQLSELMRASPQLATVIADLYVRNLDVPGGDQIADRLQKLLPPQIRPPDEKQPPPQVLAQQVQQLQGTLQQFQAQHVQLVEALHNAHDRIDAKEQDILSRERIALIQAQTELLKTKANLNSKDANAMLDRQAELIHRRLELVGVDEPADDTSTAETPRGVTAAIKTMQSQPPQGVPNGKPGGPGAVPGAGPGAAGGPGGAPGPGLPGAGPGVGGGIPIR